MCTLCQARDPSIENHDMHGAENFSGGDVSVAATKPVHTYDQIADYLTKGFWSEFGTVARHFDVQSGGTITYNLEGLKAYGAETARKALDAWTAVSGLQFQEVAKTSAQMVLDDTNSGAYASSIVSGGHIIKSTINIHSSWSNYGDYYYQTFMHEIGHALGLGHTGDYNGSADYAADAGYANDSWQTSVMSYFSQSENTWTDATHMYLATLQLGDIAAIHKLYGTPVNVECDDTVYGDGESTGGRFGMDLSGTYAVAIVDSGGTDLINLASRSFSQYLSLVAETYSNLNGRTGNFSIGRDTVIENVITGSGNDHIVGNAAGNRIESRAGNDTISAGAGDDTLIGGAGADALTGGTGADRFVLSALAEAGDTITDFSLSEGDRVDVSGLLDAIGYTGDDLVADGIFTLQAGSGGAWLMVFAGGSSVHLAFLQGISASADPTAIVGIDQPAPELDLERRPQLNREDTVHDIISGDGVIGPASQNIEMNGVGLQLNTDEKYLVVDGGVSLTVSLSGTPMGPDSLPGWQAIHAGSDGADGYNLLWLHESGERAIWALDSTGAHAGSLDIAKAVDYEDRFKFDIDGDGLIGHTVSNIDAIGVKLWSTSKNEYQLSDGDGGTSVKVSLFGTTIGPESLPGWQAIQAGSDDTGTYTLLWQHESGARAIWALDETGAQIGNVDMANAIDYEDLFAFDINGDGFIGFFSNSGVGLHMSNADQYMIIDGNTVATVSLLGTPMGPNSLPGWEAIQAAPNGTAGFSLLWEHEFGTKAIWELNSAGAWSGNVDMRNAIDHEDQFDFDINGDGIIGHTLNDIELDGVELWASSINTYIIGDGNSLVSVELSGAPIGPNSLPGWEAIHAGSDGSGGYNLLWKHESGEHAIWALGSNGSRTGNVDMTHAVDFEERFAFDLNEDGVIGEWIF